MKARLMAGVLGIVMAVSFAFAEDFVTSVAPNSKAMLFSFSGLSNLGANTFNGGLGGKYFLSDVLALRASLQFAHASQNDLANPGVGQVGTDGSRTATQFGASAAVEYHLLKTRVSPYVGGNVGFSTTSTEQKSFGSVTPPNVFTQTTTDNSTAGLLGYTAGTTFSVAAITGVEFFLTKELSLTGEYQLGFGTTSRPDMTVTTGT